MTTSRPRFLLALALLPACLSAVSAQDNPAGEKSARLKRLPTSPLLLKTPEGVAGDFAVAKTAPAVDFAVFPGQWEGARLWSCWGDSLAASDGAFYASIGDHDAPHGTAYVYRIDPKKKTVRQVVDFKAVIGVKDKSKYTPGKIHGKIVEGRDGWLYFFGYRGSVRQTGAGADYRGDWLLRHQPTSGRTEDLGFAVPYCSVPVLLYHSGSHSLYGLAAPGKTAPKQVDRFFRYDLAKRKLVFNGGPVPNMARALILAPDGRAWFGAAEDGERGPGVLVRYDPAKNQITRLDARIPGDGMLRAASRVDKNGLAWCISKDGLLFSFDTKTETVKPLKELFVGQPLYTAACRLDPSGRYLYYVPGAHGRSSRSGTPVIQYNVKTGQRKVLAFLHQYLRKQEGYHLGGTYGIALSADGGQLFINFNGAPAENRRPDFGQCSAIVLHIPPDERGE